MSTKDTRKRTSKKDNKKIKAAKAHQAALDVQKIIDSNKLEIPDIKLTGSLKDFLRVNIDWIRIIKTIERLAVGGTAIMNGHGILVVSQPDLDACRTLLNYGFGMPVQGHEIDESAKKSMEEFSKIAKNIFLPTTSSVSEDGKLTMEVADELSTVPSES